MELKPTDKCPVTRGQLSHLMKLPLNSVKFYQNGVKTQCPNINMNTFNRILMD